jgi:hypothetical protein
MMKIKFEWINNYLGTFCLRYVGDKPTSDSEAKRITVAKWKAICDKLKENPKFMIENGGVGTCGFCMLYGVDLCIGCPVYKATGEISCFSTPYYSWMNNRDLPSAEAELKFVNGVKIVERNDEDKI